MTRILVVEDEPGIALGLEDDLKMEGYYVEVVGNAAGALERTRQAVFDLVVLDVMLPDRDGFEVCRVLAAEQSLVDAHPDADSQRLNRKKSWASNWAPTII